LPFFAAFFSLALSRTFCLVSDYIISAGFTFHLELPATHTSALPLCRRLLRLTSAFALSSFFLSPDFFFISPPGAADLPVDFDFEPYNPSDPCGSPPAPLALSLDTRLSAIASLEEVILDINERRPD
jgi:hypothetical protein